MRTINFRPNSFFPWSSFAAAIASLLEPMRTTASFSNGSSPSFFSHGSERLTSAFLTISTDLTVPTWPDNFSKCESRTLTERFPTYSFTLMAILLLHRDNVLQLERSRYDRPFASPYGPTGVPCGPPGVILPLPSGSSPSSPSSSESSGLPSRPDNDINEAPKCNSAVPSEPVDD